MSIFKRLLAESEFMPEVVGEYLCGRPDRLDGAGLGVIRRSLGMKEPQLAEALGCDPYEIVSWEDDRKALIPETVDLKLRKLFLSR